MKLILVLLSFLLLLDAALGCPGGDLKIVKVGDHQVAEVNLTRNSVLVTDPQAHLTYLGLKPTQLGIEQIICSDFDYAPCVNPQDIGIDLVADRTAQLTMHFQFNENNGQYRSIMSDFMIYRGVACDDSVQ